jgi:hypothetical protein
VIARLKEKQTAHQPTAAVEATATFTTSPVTTFSTNGELLNRYAATTGNAGLLTTAAHHQHPKVPALGGAPRPPNTPTVPHMMLALLLEAEKRGAKGLTSNEIMIGINDRWWPGVAVNLIMPTVYRCISKKHFFAKKDKLIVRRDDGGQPSRRVGGPDLLNLNS